MEIMDNVCTCVRQATVTAIETSLTQLLFRICDRDLLIMIMQSVLFHHSSCVLSFSHN